MAKVTVMRYAPAISNDCRESEAIRVVVNKSAECCQEMGPRFRDVNRKPASPSATLLTPPRPGSHLGKLSPVDPRENGLPLKTLLEVLLLAGKGRASIQAFQY